MRLHSLLLAAVLGTSPSLGCSTTGWGGARTIVLLALVVALRLAASHLCRRRGREQAGDGAGRHDVGG